MHKKKLTLVIFTILSYSVLGQSKKLLIAQFTQQYDSLITVQKYNQGIIDSLIKANSYAETESKRVSDHLIKLTKQNEILERELSENQKERIKLTEELNLSISKLIKIQNEKSEEHSKLKIKSEELIRHESFLNKKIDSLITELNIIKQQESNNRLNQISFEDLDNSYKQNNDGNIKYYNFKLEIDSNSYVDYHPYQDLVNGKFTSFYTVYDKPKQPKAIGNYKNGVKEGIWNIYLCDGTKQLSGRYLNGKKTGYWSNYSRCNSFNLIPLDIMETSRSNLGVNEQIMNDGSNWQYSYMTLLNYISEYADLDIYKQIYEERTLFKNDLAADTLHYYNRKGQIVLKIARKTGIMFYANNKPFIKQLFKIYDGDNILPINNNELSIYYPNGKTAYQLTINGKVITEVTKYPSGKIKSKTNRNDLETRTVVFDENGKKTDEYIGGLGALGLLIDNCPCNY